MPARCVLNGLFTEPVLPLVHITESVILHPKRKSSTKHSTGTKKKQKTVGIIVVKPIPMTCSQISASNLNGKKVDTPIEESKAEKIHLKSNSSVIDLTNGVMMYLL